MKTEIEAPGQAQLPRSAAIIGVGTMGLGVAECFALAGIQVTLMDANYYLSCLAFERLKHRIRGHVDAGLLDESAIEALANVRRADGIPAAVADVDLIFEAVPERIETKGDVLAECDANASPDAIIASNTSSLPIDELAAFLTRKERFLGMHWFNPPEWIPGVEVIPSSRTDPEIVARTRAFLVAIGKRPATVGSGPGFVANRIQFALFREAVACVEARLATPQEVDEVVRSCFGFRLPFYGPFQIADMAGLDVYENIFEVLERGLGAGWEAPRKLRDIVAEGRHGSKTLAGFYDYSVEERDAMLLERDQRYAALQDLLKRMEPNRGARSEASDEDD